MDYIDLRSDTVTKPTAEMREAMYRAPVGDDVYQDDPTINELEREAAHILGKEAALFVPSGTMGNQLGIMTHTRRGDEVIASADCHIFMHEVGAAAVLSSVTLRQLSYPDGVPVPAMIEAAIRPEDIHEPQTALICLENALANGRVVKLSTMAEIANIARAHQIPVHLDGARIFNAAVALGVEAKEIAQYANTVSCCLSKGLGAPVGSVLAGGADTITRARKYRKMLGGGMRQAGILAAAGLIAIRDMPKRLGEDHENAKYMAARLAQIPGVTIDPASVEINLVFFRIDSPRAVLDALPDRMRAAGVLINGEELGEMRFVTHIGVTRANIDYALDAFTNCIKG